VTILRDVRSLMALPVARVVKELEDMLSELEAENQVKSRR